MPRRRESHSCIPRATITIGCCAPSCTGAAGVSSANAMLTYLQIRDFAIIDAIELELRPGLTVLTGETGAGKSILVDALQLIAGGRAGSEVVRHAAERAEVSATFELAQAPRELKRWLEEQSISAGGELTIRRIVGS